jgi:hypothetical protein
MVRLNIINIKSYWKNLIEDHLSNRLKIGIE